MLVLSGSVNTTSKQLTPPPGDENFAQRIGFCKDMKQLTPRQGTKTAAQVPFDYFSHETTYTPLGDENECKCGKSSFVMRNNLRPARGRKLFSDFVHFRHLWETTYTPPGDENCRYAAAARCPAETTYTPSGDENVPFPAFNRAPCETTYTPPGDENRLPPCRLHNKFPVQQLTPR